MKIKICNTHNDFVFLKIAHVLVLMNITPRFFNPVTVSATVDDEKREGAVLGSIQTHFVSSIGGARQKHHRNQSWR